MTMTACPVCGTEFPAEDAAALGAFRLTHDGHEAWACSSTCRDTFDKEPERFVKSA